MEGDFFVIKADLFVGFFRRAIQQVADLPRGMWWRVGHCRTGVCIVCVCALVCVLALSKDVRRKVRPWIG